MKERPYNFLFLSTANMARSIMGEAILAQESGGQFRAFSAGSHPAGSLNPMALQLLTGLGHAVDGYRSKSWDEFAAAGAPAMDFVVSVCDDVAEARCPEWPGEPLTAHWSIPNPGHVTGTDAVRHEAFASAYRMLANRIGLFLALPHASIDRMALEHQLRRIGATS